MSDPSKPEEISLLTFGLDRISGEKYNNRNIDLDALFRNLKDAEDTLRATGAVNPRFYPCNIDSPEEVEKLKSVIRDGDSERGGKPWDTISIGYALRAHPDLTPFFEYILNYSLENGRGAKLTFAGVATAQSYLESLARSWPHMKVYLPKTKAV